MIEHFTVRTVAAAHLIVFGTTGELIVANASDKDVETRTVIRRAAAGRAQALAGRRLRNPSGDRTLLAGVL